MVVSGRFLQILGCNVAIALAGCSANGLAPGGNTAAFARPAATGTDWIRAGNMAYHVPQYLPTVSSAKMASGKLFQYNGGPVLTNPKAYLILWGYKRYGDPDKVANLLQEYLKVEGGSGHNNIYTQYYQMIGGKTTYIANPRNQYGGVWDDEQDAVPRNPTEEQIAREALRGVAKFGYDSSGSYIVATPHGRNSKGFGTAWCSDHSDAHLNSEYVSYTNLPYIPDAGEACGADFISGPKDERSVDEGVTIIEGNEYGDSVTDPVPGTGWVSYEGGEIGGACVWADIENDPFRSKLFTMQPMYSNAGEACVQSY
jgi:hypothetical protein